MFEDLFYVLEKYHTWLWKGLGLTLELLVISVVLGTLLAVPLAIARSSNSYWVRLFPWTYIYVFRGTPLLVQLFLIYYGLGQLFNEIDGLRQSVIWPYLRDAYWYCVLAFVLNTAAYVAEIMRGGIQNVPHGEIEAGRACGMSEFTLYRRIILPRMWQIIWPAYTNDVIFTLKATALASVVTVLELTGMAKKIMSRTYLVWESLLTAAVVYLVIVFILTRIFKYIEKRLRVDTRQNSPASQVPG